MIAKSTCQKVIVQGFLDVLFFCLEREEDPEDDVDPEAQAAENHQQQGGNPHERRVDVDELCDAAANTSDDYVCRRTCQPLDGLFVGAARGLLQLAEYFGRADNLLYLTHIVECHDVVGVANPIAQQVGNPHLEVGHSLGCRGLVIEPCSDVAQVVVEGSVGILLNREGGRANLYVHFSVHFSISLIGFFYYKDIKLF